MDVLFQNICTNEKFLYSAFYGFDNTQVCDLLEQAGCPAENGAGRPGISGIRSFFGRDRRPPERTSHKYQVDVHLHTEVKKILTKET